VLEDFVLDAGEERLCEYLIDDEVLPWLCGLVLLGEGLYAALAEETSGKVWDRIGDGDLEICQTYFLALCWAGVIEDRFGAFSGHHRAGRETRFVWEFRNKASKISRTLGIRLGTERSGLGVWVWTGTGVEARQCSLVGLDLEVIPSPIIRPTLTLTPSHVCPAELLTPLPLQRHPFIITRACFPERSGVRNLASLYPYLQDISITHTHVQHLI
jgi:hypothetical protein